MSRPRSLAAAVAALALALVAAAPADAALSVRMDGTGVIVADASETDNRLTITADAIGVVVHDESADIVLADPTDACNHADGSLRTVRCAGAVPVVTGTLGPGRDLLTLGGGVRAGEVRGEAGADVLTGGDGADRLLGGDDGDLLTGGGGADTLIGEAGSDELRAADGAKDAVLNCDGPGPDDLPGTDDLAVADAVDEVPVPNCNRVDKGGATAATPSTPSAPVASPTQRTVQVPDARPRQDRRLRFTSLLALQRQLDKLKVPYRLSTRAIDFATVNDALRKKIDDGEITKQGGAHRPGAKVTIEPAANCGGQPACRLEVSVTYYDAALDLLGERCPYRGARSKELMRVLEARTYDDAVTILDDLGCRFRIVDYDESASHTQETIDGASVDSDRVGRARRYFVELRVERPIRSDFTVTLGPRPASDWVESPGDAATFDREIDLGTDGRLTSSAGNFGVLTVTINENFTSRFVEGVSVELVKQPDDGSAPSIIASQRTGRAGAATFTFPVGWTGRLEVNVRVTVKRNAEDLASDTLRGWATVPVVERTARTFTTSSGRLWKRSGERYVRTTAETEQALALAQAIRDMVSGLGSRGHGCRDAAQRLDGAALVEACWREGVAVVRATSGGTTAGPAARGTVAQAPGLIATSSGLREVPLTALVVPSTTSILGLALIGNDAGSLVGPDGATLIGPDGATLIGPDGATLVGPDGATLIGMDGATLIGPDGATLIGMDGATLTFAAALAVANPVAPFVSDQGGGLASKLDGVPLLGAGSALASRPGAALISDKGVGIISDNGAGLLPLARVAG